MKARHLTDSASHGPEALKAIGQAFDAAWREIAGNFGDDPRDVELARVKLANALLSVACEDSRDVEAPKNGALQAMGLAYRERCSEALEPRSAIAPGTGIRGERRSLSLHGIPNRMCRQVADHAVANVSHPASREVHLVLDLECASAPMLIIHPRQ